MKFNPFTPNGLVAPGMFAGRVEELLELEKALFQAKHGNPPHFLLHGERGIGKSSLMFVVQRMAAGLIVGPSNRPSFHFLTVNVEIEPATSYADLIRKIGRELSREAKKLQAVETAVAGVWDFLTRWEVAGIKFNKMRQSDPEDITESLCETIQNLTVKLGGD